MIVIGMHGQYLKFVTIYESSEWSEVNPKGVVRLSREVASEILWERKLEHAIVFLLKGKVELRFEEWQHELRTDRL
jgi:hypothetical protein